MFYHNQKFSNNNYIDFKKYLNLIFFNIFLSDRKFYFYSIK